MEEEKKEDWFDEFYEKESDEDMSEFLDDVEDFATDGVEGFFDFEDDADEEDSAFDDSDMSFECPVPCEDCVDDTCYLSEAGKRKLKEEKNGDNKQS